VCEKERGRVVMTIGAATCTKIHDDFVYFLIIIDEHDHNPPSLPRSRCRRALSDAEFHCGTARCPLARTPISRGEVCFWRNPPSRTQNCRQRRSRATRTGAWVCFAIGRRSGPDAKQGKLRAGRCLEPRKTCSAWWPRPPRSCGDDQRPPARSEGTGERPPHPRSIQHEGWVDERRGSHR